MAGDLPFEEILVIHDPVGELPAPGAAAAERSAVYLHPDTEQTRVLLRFGDRVEIRAGAEGRSRARVPDVAASVLQALTPTERFGVEALQLRNSPAFAQAKAARPRDGQRWDMPGCAEPLPPSPVAAASAAPAPGTSDYLMGSVALGVVIVNGPTTATQFTAAEQSQVVAEVPAGGGWVAGFNPWAGVSFSYDIRPVSITTQPNATASDNESRFRDPAVAALGFQANWNGVGDYVNSLRHTLQTHWTY